MGLNELDNLNSGEAVTCSDRPDGNVLSATQSLVLTLTIINTVRLPWISYGGTTKLVGFC